MESKMGAKFVSFAGRIGLPLLLLAASVALNIALAERVRKQRSEIAFLSSDGIREGASAPPIEAVDLAGTPSTIRYSDVAMPTVVYVFASTCHWCVRNASNLKSLIAAVAERYRFVGLSLAGRGTQEQLDRLMPADFQVYISPSESAIVAYKFAATPDTFVVSGEGKILKRWHGAWTGDNRTGVERFFQCSLPGLLPEPNGKAQ